MFIFRHINPTDVLQNETIKDIASKHKKTPAQIILKYFIQNNVVVIPKSVTPSRLRDNFDLFSITLDENDEEEIRKLDKGRDGKMFDTANINPT